MTVAPVYPDYQYIEVYDGSSWIDISSYVVSDIYGEYGFTTLDEDDRTASIGLISFTLDNSNGHFNPKHANYTAGFDKDSQVRIRIGLGDTEKTITGYVDDFPQTDLSWGERQFIEVRLVDWMDYVARFPVKDLSVSINQRTNEAVTTLLGLTDVQPDSTSLSSGTYVFDRVFDDITPNNRIVTEFRKLSASEFSYIYLKSDGTLVSENRDDRSGLTPLSTFGIGSSGFLLMESDDYLLQENDDKFIIGTVDTVTGTFTNELLNLDTYHSRDIINRVNLTAVVRELDTSFVDLVHYPIPIYLQQGVPHTINIKYTDPNNRSTFINGYNMQAPSGTADYEAYQYQTASGTNYTSTTKVTATFYSSYAIYNLVNYSASCWVTTLDGRGLGLYDYVPAELTLQDDVSVAAHGIQEFDLDQRYQSSLEAGTADGNSVIAVKKDLRATSDMAHFIANTSQNLMSAFLGLDMGDLVEVTNPESNIDEYAFIHGVKFRLTRGGVIEYWWKTKELFCFRKGLQPLAMSFSGLTNSNQGVEFDPSPLYDSSGTPFSANWWTYLNSPFSANYSFHPVSKCYLDGSSTITNGWYVFLENDGVLHFHAAFDAVVGHWLVSGTGIDTLINRWIPLGVSYNPSSAANDPIFYITGSAQTTSVIARPSGTFIPDWGIPLIAGNVGQGTGTWLDYADMYQKDTRLYNRVLSAAEFTGLASNENDYSYLANNAIGLTFHGFGCRADLSGSYIGQYLDTDDWVVEQVHGYKGIPQYNTVSGSAYRMQGADPSYPIYPYALFSQGVYTSASTGILGSWSGYDSTPSYTITGSTTPDKIKTTDNPQGYMYFQVTGTSFVIGYLGASGTNTMHMIIDDGAQINVDTNITGSPPLERFYISDWLGGGIHSVKLWGGGDGSSYILWDALQVLGLTPLTAGKYDQDNANIVYTKLADGLWWNWDNTALDGSAYGGSIQYAGTGMLYARAAFAFTGTQFKVIYTQRPERGEVEVYVDGTYVDTIVETGSPVTHQVEWTSGVVSNDTHWVLLLMSTGDVVDLDAVEII